jgi:hypothetical protein
MLVSKEAQREVWPLVELWLHRSVQVASGAPERNKTVSAE